MSLDLLYEPTADFDEAAVLRSVYEILYSNRNDLYPQFGTPNRRTMWNGLDPLTGLVSSDWANDFSIDEATLGQAIRARDGLNNLIFQGDNNGLYGELDWETTENMTVGVDLTVGQDGAFGRDVSVGRNLDVVNDGHIGGDIVVDLTSTLTGAVGIGQAPAAFALAVTGNSKFTGTGWFTGDVGIKVTPSGDFGLEIADDIGPSTDNTRDLGSASKQWAEIHGVKLLMGTDFLVVDPANDLITVDTDLLAINRNLRTVSLGTGPIVHFNEAEDTNDTTGMIRAMSWTAANPQAGKATAMFYNSAADLGAVSSQEWAAGVPTYKPLWVIGSDILLRANTTTRIQVNGTGIGFFGATPAAKPTVSGSRGGNAALADLLTELATLGLITDSSTA